MNFKKEPMKITVGKKSWTCLATLLLAALCLCACRKEAEPAKEERSAKEAQPPVILVREGSAFSAERKEQAETEEKDPMQEFYLTEITDALFARMEGKSFQEDCTLPREDLRYLHVLHKTADGETLAGELVVNRHIAKDVLEIFRELYLADYPIEKIRLIDDYDADDDRSMEDNNSSCFNFRLIAGTTRISKHGLGLAIDVNPLYNPYVTKKEDGSLRIEPESGTPYADRTQEFPYKIDENDKAYQLFTEYGFEWGGSWKNSKDYQHFEMPKSVVEELYPEQ